MKTASVTLESLSPYSQSRAHTEPKLEKEGPADYEARTWRSKMHVNKDGFVFIPPMAFKFSLEKAGSVLRMRIPGKGQSEYGKHFKMGIIVPEPLVLKVKAKDVLGLELFVGSSGKRNDSTRVWRTFPDFPEWSGVVTYLILDDTITKKVFEQHLKEAGNFIGVGRFRPENGGFYGRYQVNKINWS
jgi:hypothetical protein